MNKKYLAIIICSCLVVSIVCVSGVLTILHRHNKVIQETTAYVVETVPVVAIEETVYVMETVEEMFPTKDPEVSDNIGSNDTAEEAVFDYDGLEYWQQLVLNNIAKNISQCSDDENVVILEVVFGEEIGHIVVDKNGEIFEADFDMKTYGVISDE